METEAMSAEFQSLLAARGVSRRSFLKLCGTIAVAAGLSELAAPRVAQALEGSVIGATKGNLYPVIWIEGASCTGCTESFAQVETPDPASVVLDLISLNYCETLSAAAGHSMEEAKDQTIEAGNYILVYEGAILEGWGGEALRVADEPGTEHLKKAAAKANAVVALGSCAVNGGWMGAHPNSSDALGVQQFLRKNGIETPVVNVPGCPANPEWLVSVLVDVVVMKLAPSELDLTSEGKPAGICGQTIPDTSERRGHFENGEFVYEFGSVEEAKGYETLMKEFGLTQEAVAKRVGKSRPVVANALRILSLPEYVLSLLEKEEINAGQARSLIPIKEKLSDEDFKKFVDTVKAKNLTVRDIEAYAKKLSTKPKIEIKENPADIYLREIEKDISDIWGRKIKISGVGKKGKIEIEYYDEDDFEALIEKMKD